MRSFFLSCWNGIEGAAGVAGAGLASSIHALPFLDNTQFHYLDSSPIRQLNHGWVLAVYSLNIDSAAQRGPQEAPGGHNRRVHFAASCSGVPACEQDE